MGVSKQPSAERPFVALRHPTRRAILTTALEADVVSPKELGQRIGVPVSTTAYHVRVLAEAEILQLVRTRPARGSTEHFYRCQLTAKKARRLLAEAAQGKAPEAETGRRESAGEEIS